MKENFTFVRAFDWSAMIVKKVAFINLTQSQVPNFQ
jgi:hypothetical protein